MRVVWVSPVKSERMPRLGLEECPVSFVSGESHALLDDFVAHIALGVTGSIQSWPARRVDAFALLHRELQQIER